MADPNEQSSDILELANLYRMQAVLERMLVRVDETKGTADAPTVTVQDTSLYALAAKYYGSADQWVIIADANGIIEPQITKVTTLIIPDWDGVDRGGEFDN